MNRKKKILIGILAFILVGFLIPQNLKMPVQGATTNDFNHQSFWYYPWGSSIVHKGVDIFARKGTSVHAASIGIVLYTGNAGKGGNAVVVLSPKWRLHYYAHLDKIKTSMFSLVGHGSEIGTVGNTGNAATTPSHLHYGIGTMLPFPWRIDNTPLGWQKMFYLNPIDFLKQN